jgi:hypothetical protein
MRGVNDAVMSFLMDTLVKVPAVELAYSILGPEN